MRIYVGDRSGGEPRVLVVEREPPPDPKEIVRFLAELSHLHDDDHTDPAGAARRRAALMTEKEALLARIRAAEEGPVTPRPLGRPGPAGEVDWGQHGPGAFDLARAILAEETGGLPSDALTRQFVDEVVAHLPGDTFQLPATEVGYWLEATPDRHTAEAQPPATDDCAAQSSPALAIADPDLEAAGGTPPGPTASALVSACEEAWSAIKRNHPELPEAVIVLGSGVERGRLVKLGHWWSGRWVADGEARGEVLLAGEALHLPPAAVFEVLLHEAAHGLNAARGVKDTSRGGRYHNARFRDAAEEVGLVVEPMPPYGLARTTLAPLGEERYAEAVSRLGDAMRIARQLEPGKTIGPGQGQESSGTGGGAGTARSRTSAMAQCPCGRRLRMAPSVLAAGPVLCGLCGAEFAGGAERSQSPDRMHEEVDTVVDHSFLARRRSAVDAEAGVDDRVRRAVAVLERQQATLESALTTAGPVGLSSLLEPLRQRRELVRVLLEELGDGVPDGEDRSADLVPTAVQEDGVRELLAGGSVPDDELSRWYQRFGTAEEEPMVVADPVERERRSRLARALLKADGTLAGPAVDLSGIEVMAGERVVVIEDDNETGVPAGVLGTVKQVHPDETAVSVDFATLGRLKVTLADSLADRLRHDYVTVEDAHNRCGSERAREALALEAERSAPGVEV